MTYEELKLFTYQELSTLRYSEISLVKFIILKKHNNDLIELTPDIEQKLKHLIDQNYKEYKKLYGESLNYPDKLCKLSQLSTLFLNLLKIGQFLAPVVEEIIDQIVSLLN